MPFSMQHRVAVDVADPAIEILDRAQAVAAQGQRVGELAEAVLTDVEHVLAVVRRLRRAVRHHHLDQRCAVADRPVGELDVVQGDRLAGVEADHQRPVVPADGAAFHREADALGLLDVDRPQVVAGLLDELAIVVAVRLGDRRDAIVVDPDDLHLLDVDHRVEALDRVGIEIVVGARLDPAEGMAEVQALLALDPEIAGRPRVDADQLHVRDAALGAGLDEARVALDRGLDLEELLELDHRARLGQEALREHLLVGDRDHQAPDADIAGAEHVDARLAGDRIARREAAHHGLGGLVQLDRLEAQRIAELGHRRAHDGRDLADLVPGQGLQRMQHRHRRRGAHAPLGGIDIGNLYCHGFLPFPCRWPPPWPYGDASTVATSARGATRHCAPVAPRLTSRCGAGERRCFRRDQQQVQRSVGPPRSWDGKERA